MMDAIQLIAQEFTTGNFFEFGTADEYMQRVDSAMQRIQHSPDRIRFLGHLLIDLDRQAKQHRKQCTKPAGKCNLEKNLMKVSYFLEQESLRYGAPAVADRFTPKEEESALDMLRHVLNNQEQLKAGQGVIAEEIEELKELMGILGKRKWYRLFAGSLLNWAGSEVTSQLLGPGLAEEINAVLGQVKALN